MQLDMFTCMQQVNAARVLGTCWCTVSGTISRGQFVQAERVDGRPWPCQEDTNPPALSSSALRCRLRPESVNVRLAATLAVQAVQRASSATVRASASAAIRYAPRRDDIRSSPSPHDDTFSVRSR